MAKKPEKTCEPQPIPSPLPSDSIPGLPPWVFIPENRGGNPPPTPPRQT